MARPGWGEAGPVAVGVALADQRTAVAGMLVVDPAAAPTSGMPMPASPHKAMLDTRYELLVMARMQTRVGNPWRRHTTTVGVTARIA